jgi:3-dehydroshikimate dehydratase
MARKAFSVNSSWRLGLCAIVGRSDWNAFTERTILPSPGLVSVTLRHLPPEQVALAAGAAGLTSVEWGADVHAPPLDARLLERCRGASASAGLRIASYGSYWKAGSSSADEGEAVLAAASILGAPRVRVWAGQLGSEHTDAETRMHVVHALRSLGRRAADLGLEIAVEHHPDTLSDTAAMTLRLLDEVGSDVVTTYWQPDIGQPTPLALAELDALLEAVPERLSAVHVFAWWPAHERHELATREDLWAPALDRIRESAPGCDVMLEFVPGDSVEVLVDEARTLHRLLAT